MRDFLAAASLPGLWAAAGPGVDGITGTAVNVMEVRSAERNASDSLTQAVRNSAWCVYVNIATSDQIEVAADT